MTAETKALINVLIDRQGTLFSQELGIDLTRDKPSPLFQWLCASLLLSARISHNIAMAAARALSDAGWTTAEKIASSDWKDRVAVLRKSGYGRYDESTARMLGDTALALRTTYGGDLRQLRKDAGREPQGERKRLMAFKGIGPVGADIFFREVQVVWPELYPFADRKALAGAVRFGLPGSAKALSKTIDRQRFPNLVAALVRVELDEITPGDLWTQAQSAEVT